LTPHADESLEAFPSRELARRALYGDLCVGVEVEFVDRIVLNNPSEQIAELKKAGRASA
jgi:hypothetical protein